MPWERFVKANESVSQRSANTLASGVESQAKGVQSELDAAGKKQQQDIASNYAKQESPRGPKAAREFNTTTKGETGQQPKSSFGSPWGSFGSAAPSGETLTSMAETAPEPPRQATLQDSSPKVAASPARSAAKPASGLSATSGFAQASVANQRPSLDPDRLDTELPGDGSSRTTAGDLAGSQSLEEQFNAAKPGSWQDFLGRTLRADEAASALGDESGVEALLERTTGGPASQFDAALVGGAGGKRFDDLAKEYGGGALQRGVAGAEGDAQGRWAQLMADVERESAARDASIRDATAEMNRLAAQGPGEAEPPSPFGAHTNHGVGGYSSFEEFMEQMAIGGGIHGVAEDLSLADQFINKLGEGGIYEGKNVAGTFRDSTLGDGFNSVAGSLDDQNRYGALQNVETMYGAAAAEWVWRQLTEDIWGSMSGKNQGAIYRTLANLIEAGLASGALQRDANGQVHEALSEERKQADAAADAALTKAIDINTGRSSGESVTSADGSKSREMTPGQKYGRDYAYQNGWGEEWDRQFLEGADQPIDPNPPPSSSGQITYDEDGNAIGLS